MYAKGEEVFCVNCGQVNFVEVDSSAQEAVSEEPSNKKSWKSVVIGIVAVIAFIIISSVGENFFDNYLHKITTENSGVEYTPGTVSGNTYVNEWAEISVTVAYIIHHHRKLFCYSGRRCKSCI